MSLTAPDVVVATAGQPVTFDVLANDPGSWLSVIAFDPPAQGTLVHEGGGRFTYTPPAGFSGVVSFGYTVSDSAGTTETGAVTISVLLPNTRPVAGEDRVETAIGTPVDIPVLANDSDADGDPLQLVAIGTPLYGSVMLRPDSAVRYQPQDGFQGIDRFTYTVSDGRGGFAQGTVTVRVGAGNRPPEAADDTFEVRPGTTAEVAPLANDVDPDGDVLRFLRLEVPAHGRIEVVGARLRYHPDPGFEGTDRFAYTVDDGRGGTASATVTLEVRRANGVPVATDDVVSTPAGTPVTIRLLDNDADPDGDPLELAAVDLPAHGDLSLGPDGVLVYTPASGFTGTDSFRYTVRDPRGATASAAVTVEVLPASGLDPLFPNGFRYRRRILLPPQEEDAQLSDFRLPLLLEDPALAHADHGGHVAHPQGFDIRFESEDGTKLAHDLVHFDPQAGRLFAVVRLPSWRTGTQSRIFLYYGNPGITVAEADAAAVWQDDLAVWHPADGVDRTGNGHHLAVNGVAADTSGALPLAVFDGATSAATLDDPSFLSGHDRLCVRFFMIPDAAMAGTDRHVLLQGTPDVTSRDFGLVFRFDDAGGQYGGDDMWFFVLKTSSGEDAWYQSPSHIHETGTPQLVHAFWRSGEHPQVWRNGMPLPAAWAGRRRADGAFDSGPVSGTVTVVPGHPLSIGVGSLSPDHAFVGSIGLVGLTTRLPLEAEIRLEARALLEPHLLWALGPEERADMEDLPPVAADIAVRTTSGARVDIVPGDHAFDPEGDPLTPEVTSQPAHGTVITSGGALRYVPEAGFVGSDVFGYAVRDVTGQSAAARVHVLVERSDSPSTTAELPTPLRELVVRTGSELAAALAAAAPGDHVVLEDGDYSGHYEMHRSGTPEHPVVIRARNVLGARIGIRGISFPDPAVHDVMVWGIDFRDCNFMRLNGRRIVFRRCRIWPAYRPEGAQGIWAENCEDCRIDYCTLRLYTVPEVLEMGATLGANGSPWNDNTSYGCIRSYVSGSMYEAGIWPRRVVIERCRLEGGPAGVPYSAPNCQFIEWGGDTRYHNAWDRASNRPVYPMDNVVRIIYGRVERDSTIIDNFCAGVTFDRIHIVGPGKGAWQLRDGPAHTVRRCRLEGGVYMAVHGPFHHIRDVVGTVWIMAGKRRWSDPIVTSADRGAHRACEDTEVHNCPGAVVVGHTYSSWASSGETIHPARNILVANCPNALVTDHAVDVTVQPTSPHPPEDPPVLDPSQTGHDAPWVGVEG